MTLVRRFAAVAIVSTVCFGNLSVCAGWQPTAEARMACCMTGTSCPMHRSDRDRAASRRAINQVQADNCCAATSNRTQFSVAHSTFVLSNAAALPAAVSNIIPLALPVLREWRALVPLPVSAVPKHLLLSVLLV
jgi:hypothetical protein